MGKRGKNFTRVQKFPVKFCEWKQGGRGCELLSFVQMTAWNTKDRFRAGVYVVPFLLVDASKKKKKDR